MHPRQTPIANPIVVLREEFDDWAVLFNPDSAKAVGTNPVGVAVWKRMDGKTSLAEILSDVKADFDDTPESAFDEITSFVDKLTADGFVLYEVPDDVGARDRRTTPGR